MANPSQLGLYYIPPSGRENGVVIEGYKIYNVNRDRFDQWLRDTAEKNGVSIQYKTECIGFEYDREFSVQVEGPSGRCLYSSEYLIGADGVRSYTRRKLMPNEDTPVMLVAQEELNAEGDFGEYFYGFFREDISKAYAYVIPKSNRLFLGLGTTPHTKPNLHQLMIRFKKWLGTEFAFNELSLVRRETWAIPFGYFHLGVGNALLVGDAAGLCNPLSGEGIRPAIESAEAAAAAITTTGDSSLVNRYARNVEGLVFMLKDLNRFVRSMDNAAMEEFIHQEAKRQL